MTFWTKERDEELLKLQREGKSHSEIGEALGCSRAAAAGRAHRLQEGEVGDPELLTEDSFPKKTITLAGPRWSHEGIGGVS